jgi:PAS domain S-box-containing protein
MTVDPQLIRSEPHPQIGGIVQRDAELLLRRWTQRALHEQPDAQRAHHATIRDHLSTILCSIGESLESDDPDEVLHRDPALLHGQQRWEVGWSITEVVRDYQILRMVIIDHLLDELDRPLELREIMAIGLVLDEAIAASVEKYSLHRDEHVRALERERTERILEANGKLRKWEQIFKHAGWGATVSVDSSDILETVNVAFAEMHGYAVEELSGMPLRELLAPESREQADEQLRQIHEKGHHVYEAIHLGKDGSTFPVLTDVSAFKDSDGNVLYRAGYFQDITDRKSIESQLVERAEQLLDADRRKNEFMAVLGHELRNPLGAISNAVELCRLVDATDPLFSESQDIIHRQTQHMQRLVDDLLDVARIARGKIELRMQRVQIAAAVEHALAPVRPLIESRGHQLELSLPEEPLVIEADPARLEQILVNLINNAAKYTNPRGRLRINVSREGDFAAVQVSDNGIGISSEMLPRIFDLFTQANPVADHAHDGLGIGLTLVRSLVELHHGTIAAASAGSGLGSTFTVRFPICVNGQASLTPAKDQAAGAGALGAKILLVDDNQDVARLLAAMLNYSGHEVQIAGDGPSAIEAARQSRPQVILLDIGLPGMNGYELAERLRMDEGLDGVLLVALTGYGQEEDRRRSQEAGFDHHLVKPVRLEMLQELLTQVVATQS